MIFFFLILERPKPATSGRRRGQRRRRGRCRRRRWRRRGRRGRWGRPRRRRRRRRRAAAAAPAHDAAAANAADASDATATVTGELLCTLSSSFGFYYNKCHYTVEVLFLNGVGAIKIFLATYKRAVIFEIHLPFGMLGKILVAEFPFWQLPSLR